MTSDELVEVLRDAAIERGHRVTGDDFVDTRAAADLLARSPRTLRNWRAQDDPIPWRRINGRTQYALPISRRS